MAGKTLVLGLIFYVGIMLSATHTEGRSTQLGDLTDFGLQAAVAESNAGPPRPATEKLTMKPTPEPSCTPSVKRENHVIDASIPSWFRDTDVLRLWNVAAKSVSIIFAAKFKAIHVFRRFSTETPF